MPTISYNKLWKLLIDEKMNKKDLRLAAGVSTAVIAKLGKGDNVTTDVLLKICNVLNCDIADIMEVKREQNGGARVASSRTSGLI
jgi:DNA-binding Xre family transcriptional regulator